MAKELGFFGSNEVEAAQIDCYCEHVRDIREAYGKAVGSPFAPPSPDAEEKINKWFDEDMPNWCGLPLTTSVFAHCYGCAFIVALESLPDAAHQTSYITTIERCRHGVTG